MSNITAPIFPKLLVTEDYYGGGVNDEGVAYRTWDIFRPATATRIPTLLASITIYDADDITPLVWDRYTGDARKGDLNAIQLVRNVLASDYPTARANSFRFTAI